MTTAPDGEQTLLRVWTRGVWPALAVPVVYVGVAAAVIRVGLGIMLVSCAALVLTVWVSLWVVMRETPGLRLNVPRTAWLSGLAAVVMAGWTEVSTVAGLVVPLLLLVTSPPAVRFAVRQARKQRAARHAPPALPTRVRLDPDMVDQRFTELVKNLEESGGNHEA